MDNPSKKSYITITIKDISENNEQAYSAEISGKVSALVLGDTMPELFKGIELSLED